MKTVNRIDEELAALRESIASIENEAIPGSAQDILHALTSRIDSLLPQARAKQDALDTLLATAQTFTASTELSAVLSAILNAVITFTQAGRGFLALVGDGEGELRIEASYNLDGLDVQTNQALIEGVLSTGLGAVSSGAGGEETGTLLCASVGVQDERVGVIYLDHPPAGQLFTQADLEILSACAIQAGMAVQNARLSAALEASREARTQFVSTVTHELRIPMTSIKGYTDLIRQGIVGQINEQQSNFLDIIRNNVERMSALLSNLSDLSKIESGRLRLNPQVIAVAEQIEAIQDNYLAKIEAKDQVLQVEVAADIRPAYADPDRVFQVLDNLVSNAHLYTPQAGRIQIQARNLDDSVLIQVRDDGIGISKEDQGGLFSQFFRSEDLVVRDQQGWGLGLSVACELITLMKGTIGVDSQLGTGSTFWFTLPAQEMRET